MDNGGAVSNIAKVTITVNPPQASAQLAKSAIKVPEKTFSENPSVVKNSFEKTSALAFSKTVYEDAEDGTIDGWTAYGEGSITNAVDLSGNALISIEGEIDGDPFRLGLADLNDWDNSREFIASFRILIKDDAAVYFRIDTTEGEKFLCYRPGPETLQIEDNVICIGLGMEADGQWHQVIRNLEEDLKNALPYSRLLTVKDFYVYGTALLDDINLSNSSRDLK